MTNLIYQFWDGEIQPAHQASASKMADYALNIGAKYFFDDNPRFLRNHFKMSFHGNSAYYGAFKPVFDSGFDQYDNILFCDCDVFPKDGLTENIFDGFTGDIAMCTEPDQPELRKITANPWITHESDTFWADLMDGQDSNGTPLPRLEDGSVEIFNGGVVLWSKEARLRFREGCMPFEEYVAIIQSTELDNYYCTDQPYLHAMAFMKNFDVQRLDNGWNSYVHHQRYKGDNERYVIDSRDDNTKFVHVQLDGADDLDEEAILSIVNDAQEDWVVDTSLMYDVIK